MKINAGVAVRRSGHATAQASPLRLKAWGAVLAEPLDPVKPISNDSPAGMVWL